MENVIPRYTRPIPGIFEPKIEVSHWDEATDAFDDKEYKKSIIEVINFLNPEILKSVDTSGDFEVIQSQGSAEIRVKVTEEKLSIVAPFLKITDTTNKIALLRKVAEVNFSPLRLAQIYNESDKLFFQYETSLELAQPNKVYDVLRNISIYSDDFDDQFIENYNAEFLQEPKHVALTKEEQGAIWKQISDILEDYKNYTQFFKDKRWDNFQWDLIVISLMKLSNMPYVHGKLRSDLIDYIVVLFNNNLDFHYRMDKGVNYMKKIASYSQEEIMSNVYHAEFFISLRWRSSEQIITERLKHNLERVESYERDESHFSLSYYLQFTLLKLVYDYSLDDNYRQAIETVLEEISGLEPDEAAPKLAKVYYLLYSGDINKKSEVKEKKGFFSQLFN